MLGSILNNRYKWKQIFIGDTGLLVVHYHFFCEELAKHISELTEQITCETLDVCRASKAISHLNGLWWCTDD